MDNESKDMEIVRKNKKVLIGIKNCSVTEKKGCF
jgi:hypothetical protein